MNQSRQTSRSNAKHVNPKAAATARQARIVQTLVEVVKPNVRYCRHNRLSPRQKFSWTLPHSVMASSSTIRTILCNGLCEYNMCHLACLFWSSKHLVLKRRMIRGQTQRNEMSQCKTSRVGRKAIRTKSPQSHHKHRTCVSPSATKMDLQIIKPTGNARNPSATFFWLMHTLSNQKVGSRTSRQAIKTTNRRATSEFMGSGRQTHVGPPCHLRTKARDIR